MLKNMGLVHRNVSVCITTISCCLIFDYCGKKCALIRKYSTKTKIGQIKRCALHCNCGPVIGYWPTYSDHVCLKWTLTSHFSSSVWVRYSLRMFNLWTMEVLWLVMAELRRDSDKIEFRNWVSWSSDGTGTVFTKFCKEKNAHFNKGSTEYFRTSNVCFFIWVC